MLSKRPASRSKSKTIITTTLTLRVVFRLRHHADGATRYLYHGNDGTTFARNDTAQSTIRKSDVREHVIQVILEVARRFPIIRFDAAMVLAKRHVPAFVVSPSGCRGINSVSSGICIVGRGVRCARAAMNSGGRLWTELRSRYRELFFWLRPFGCLRRILRSHTWYAPGLQQRIHEHAARRRERKISLVSKEDCRIRSRHLETVCQLYEQSG